MKNLPYITLVLTALLSGCPLENPFLESFKYDDEFLSGVTVTRLAIDADSEDNFVEWTDGTIVVKPQIEALGESACILLHLANRYSFDVELYLFGGSLARNNVWFRQLSPNLVELHIEGAAIGDVFNYTLQMRDLNGPKKTNRYALPPIQCLSFNTALQKIVVDNGAVRFEARIDATATVLVPGNMAEASITGIPKDEHATIRGSVNRRELQVGLESPVLLTITAQNLVTSQTYDLRLIRGTSYIDFNNGVFVVTFYAPSDEVLDLALSGLAQDALVWLDDTIRVVIDNYVPDYTYLWLVDNQSTDVVGPVFQQAAQTLGLGRHRVTCKVFTDTGGLYSSQTVTFMVNNIIN
jgi:hypothetical protein